MDQSIEQFGRDLASAGYAKKTQPDYVKVAEHLSARFGQPVASLSREQLRTYVEEFGREARARSG